MQPARPAPALPTSHRQNYWIKAEDIDETALDKMIQEIEDLLICPISQTELERPIILIDCCHEYSEVSLRKWYANHPKVCVVCKQPDQESCADKAILHLANKILPILRTIKEDLADCKKTKATFNVTDLIKFSTMNQNAFILAMCGHSTSLKVLSTVMGHLPNTNIKIDLSSKQFVCQYPNCNKQATYALPHRNLRDISKILYERLILLVKDQADPSLKPFQAKAPATTAVVPVKIEPKPTILFESPEERTALLVKYIEENQPEKVEAYLLKNPEFLPYCKARLATACLKKLDTEKEFTGTSYKLLAFVIRFQIAPIGDYSRKFLTCGIPFLFSNSSSDAHTLLNHISNLEDPVLIKLAAQNLVDYLNQRLNTLYTLQFPQETFHIVYTFLLRHFALQNQDQIDFTIRFAKRLLKTQAMSIAISLEKLFDLNLTQFKNNKSLDVHHLNEILKLYEAIIAGDYRSVRYYEHFLEIYLKYIKLLLASDDQNLLLLAFVKVKQLPNILQIRKEHFYLIRKNEKNPLFSHLLDAIFCELIAKNLALDSNDVISLLSWAVHFSKEDCIDEASAVFYAFRRSFFVVKDHNFESLSNSLKLVTPYIYTTYYNYHCGRSYHLFFDALNILRIQMQSYMERMNEIQVFLLSEMFLEIIVIANQRYTVEVNEDLKKFVKSFVASLLNSPLEHFHCVGIRLLTDKELTIRTILKPFLEDSEDPFTRMVILKTVEKQPKSIPAYKPAPQVVGVSEDRLEPQSHIPASQVVQRAEHLRRQQVDEIVHLIETNRDILKVQEFLKANENALRDYRVRLGKAFLNRLTNETFFVMNRNSFKLLALVLRYKLMQDPPEMESERNRIFNYFLVSGIENLILNGDEEDCITVLDHISTLKKGKALALDRLTDYLLLPATQNSISFSDTPKYRRMLDLYLETVKNLNPAKLHITLQLMRCCLPATIHNVMNVHRVVIEAAEVVSGHLTMSWSSLEELKSVLNTTLEVLRLQIGFETCDYNPNASDSTSVTTYLTFIEEFLKNSDPELRQIAHQHFCKLRETIEKRRLAICKVVPNPSNPQKISLHPNFPSFMQKCSTHLVHWEMRCPADVAQLLLKEVYQQVSHEKQSKIFFVESAVCSFKFVEYTSYRTIIETLQAIRDFTPEIFDLDFLLGKSEKPFFKLMTLLKEPLLIFMKECDEQEILNISDLFLKIVLAPKGNVKTSSQFELAKASFVKSYIDLLVRSENEKLQKLAGSLMQNSRILKLMKLLKKT